MPKIIVTFVVALMISLLSFSSLALADNGSLTGDLNTKDLNHGAVIFEANCAGCHINGSNIVRRGKNLKSKALHKNKVDTQEAIASLVSNGKGIMSAYGGKLSPQEINDVSAYVLQQAAQDWQK